MILNHIQQRALYASIRNHLICSYGNTFFIAGTEGQETFQRNTLDYLVRSGFLRVNPGMTGRGTYRISVEGCKYLNHDFAKEVSKLDSNALVAWDLAGFELQGCTVVHNFQYWFTYVIPNSNIKAEDKGVDPTWYDHVTSSHKKTGMGCIYSCGTKTSRPRRFILVNEPIATLGCMWVEVSVD